MEIFHLTLGGQESAGAYSMQLRSSAGDAAGEFTLPFGGDELGALVSRVAGGLVDAAQLQRIGSDLFNSVIKAEVRRRYDEALAAAKRNGPMRIVLSLVHDELHRYPWELMHDGERFVAATGHTQLVRRMGLSAPAVPQVPPPLRVLVAVSDPVDLLPDLDVQKELAWIASATDGDDIYVEIQPAVRHIVQRRLREETFDVLHFSGHGVCREGVGCLCFESDNCCADLLVADGFKAIMEARSVPVVVLCACESAVGDVADAFTGVAQALVQSGVPAVVAMRSPLSDPGAADLAREFYATLRLDFDVVTAVTEARRALFADRLDWHAPVLYTLHVETDALKKAGDVREIPAEPSFRLDLGLRPNIPFHLEFPVAVRYTKRPEQESLAKALAASTPRLVTVDGPPGSGKTALAGEMARRAARQFCGGVLGVDCSTTNSLDAILVKLNEILLEPWDAEVDLTQPWGRRALSGVLGEHAFLIVLDNFDSVLDQAGEEPDSIIGFLRNLPAPSKALVASRDRLDIGQRVPVYTLDRWPFALLLARAGKRRGIPGFDQDLCDRLQVVVANPSKARAMLGAEQRRVFDEAHAKLGGLPFAAEIFIGLVAEGETILDLLTDLRPVHERMTDLLDQSFNRLSEGAQNLLVLMSIFAKPVKWGAIRAVCDRSDWHESLDELIRSSLVSGNRYGLHPLVREYAASKVLDAAALREAHVRAGEYFLTEDDADPLAAIDHFHAAEEWRRVVELTNSCAEKLFSLGLWTEAKVRLMKAVDAARLTGDRPGEEQSLSGLGTVAHALGEVRDAVRHHEAALAVARGVGDRETEGLHLANLARAYLTLGQTHTAEEYLEEALDLARQTGDRRAEASRLDSLGVVHTRTGHGEESIRLHSEALDIFEALGDSRGQSSVLGNLGVACAELGRVPEAIEYYEKSLSLAIDLKELGLASRAVNNLGNARRILGQTDEAIACHRHALRLAMEIGDLPGQTARLNNLGIDFMTSGELDSAIQHFDRSLAVARQIGDPEGQARALCNLGQAYLELGDSGRSMTFLMEALPVAHKAGCRHIEASCLGILGRSYLRQLQVEEAVQCLERGLAVAREIGDSLGEANSLGNLGMAYAASGRLQDATQCCVRAVQLARQIPDPGGEASHLHGLGLILSGQGQVQSALACYLLSLQTRLALRDPRAKDTEAAIHALKERLGDDEFARLLPRVDPNKDRMVEDILEGRITGD